ncbi:MAG: TonB-dependent receptor, partial [Acidobacteria bacterium]|nr:TonB-dependent receptor [Acidobacteriota bacterium]
MPILRRDVASLQQMVSPAVLLAAVVMVLGGEALAQNTPRSATQEQGAAVATSKAAEETRDGAEAARGSASGTTAQISESQLAGLPLNGRSYSQLATLQGGISDPSGASASRGTGGSGLNVLGGRATSNNFLLDGTNIMNAENQVPQSAAGVQLGSDAVLQVQVFSANYGADYGRASGGVLNSITRSGTPELHGSLFEYFRNSKLDARNFFDPDPEPPPFKRNQFGFTLTGPLQKRRTFFMASFEAMRDRLTEANIDYYPDQPARMGIITETDGTITRVPVNPRVVPYLELIPVPRGALVGRGIAEYVGIRFLPTDENFFTTRVDHQIAERDSIFLRYTLDDAKSISAQGPVDFTILNDSRQQYATLVESHVFSPSLVSSFRLGYTRPVIASESLSTIPIPPSRYFVPDAPGFGQIRIPGMTGFGPSNVVPERNIVNTFQLAGDLLAQRSRHSLKTGFDVHRYRWDVFSSWNKGGSWSFNSLESFLQAGPEGTSLTVAFPGSDNARGFRETLSGFYVQDGYRMRSDLQINLGLRYEFATLIHDLHGRTAFARDPKRDREVQIGPFLDHNPSFDNLAPRLGFTWTPGASRQTVISGGFGIYYDPLLEYAVDLRKNSAPFYKVAVKPIFDSSSTFPDAVAAAQGTPLLLQLLDHASLKSPRVLRYTVTLQEQLPGNWRGQAVYVGARGNHLYRSYEMNLAPVPTVRSDGSLFFPPYDPGGPDNRVNPAFGATTMLGSDAQSFYHSLQLSANKRTGRGNSLQASYTWSKSIDDASSPFGGGAVQASGASQYGLMRTLDRGLSDFNIRHRLVVNYFYSPPFGPGQPWLNSGFLANVLGGWRLSG